MASLKAYSKVHLNVAPDSGRQDNRCFLMSYENQRALSGSLDTRPMALKFRFAQCTPEI